MRNRNARHHIPTVVLMITVVTGAGGGALTAPAGAHQGLPSRPGPCIRAENQWARLVAANSRAKEAFDKALALQNRLIHAGRVGIAHRLDARLAHLRAIHTALVARAETVATRVQGRCSDRAPTLSDF